MKVLVCIPARYGSTRFPDKVLAKDTGKFLIQHSYEQALQAKMIEKARSFSDRARIIKTSDRIDNLLDMVRQGHQKWLSRYLPESRKLLASLRAGIEPADELDEWTITDLSTVSCSACNYLESVIDFAETFRLSNSNTGEQS